MFHSRSFSISASICGLALVGLISGCAPAASGTVVDVQESTVTVAEPDTLEQTTYRVSEDADISRNGSPASLLQIQPGDDVDITLEPNDAGRDIASGVAATSDDVDATSDDSAILDTEPAIDPVYGPTDDIVENPDEPADLDTAYEGRISAVLDNELVVEHSIGPELHFVIEEQTQMTLDDEEAELADLQPGYDVVVTAHDIYGELHAVRVDATSYEYGSDLQVPEEPGDDVTDDVVPEPEVENDAADDAEPDIEQPELPETPEPLP